MADTSISTMPAAEMDYLCTSYAKARVILEYGSGNSTEVGASMESKYIMSVESDREWARSLRAKIANSDPRSLVNISYVNIGPTSKWGRVINDRNWRQFHRYPNGIWRAKHFRQPDLVLIDGRFRTACFAACLLHTKKPIKILFDDYVGRPKYQLIEKVLKPRKFVGRMAIFNITPNSYATEDIAFLVSQYFEVSLHGAGARHYQLD